MSRKVENAVKLYLEGIRDGHYIEAVNTYTGARYTQHSTGVRDGKEGFIEFFGDFVKRCPVRDIRIIRKLEDGRNVFIQAFQDINNGDARWVTTDFFDTDEEDKIIEHWDVIAEYCDHTASGNTSVDGPAEVQDLQKTEENKELVRKLIKDAFMDSGNRDNLKNYVSEDIIQHSKDVKSGFKAFAELAAERRFRFHEVVLMVGQGNYVATLSRVTLNEKGAELELCRTDLFRIEEGRVAELWDNSEAVPEVNVNSGKF